MNKDGSRTILEECAALRSNSHVLANAEFSCCSHIASNERNSSGEHKDVQLVVDMLTNEVFHLIGLNHLELCFTFQLASAVDVDFGEKVVPLLLANQTVITTECVSFYLYWKFNFTLPIQAIVNWLNFKTLIKPQDNERNLTIHLWKKGTISNITPFFYALETLVEKIKNVSVLEIYFFQPLI